MVLSCLPALMIELKPSRNKCVNLRSSIGGWLDFMFFVFSERLMIEFSGALRGLLDGCPDLGVVVVRPPLRTSPLHYKSDLVHLQVMLPCV